MKSEQILILGIGNTLLSDDGAGVYAVDSLRRSPALPQGVRCLDGGVLAFSLSEFILQTDALIVLDAAFLDLEPGAIRLFSGTRMDSYLNSGRRSIHEVGLGDLLDMARLMNRLPEYRAMVCIQAQSLAVGSSLTPSVAQAMPEAVSVVFRLIHDWLKQEEPSDDEIRTVGPISAPAGGQST
jgi:hydrogenase maturation protease